MIACFFEERMRGPGVINLRDFYFETFCPWAIFLGHSGSSHPLHKAIHHPLLPGLVELDGEFVAVDGSDVAIAEFLVEDAVAQG